MDNVRHARHVERIAAAVSELVRRGRPIRIYHGSTNSTRSPEGRDASGMVDTSQLNRVIGFNPTNLTIDVEPNVPMDALVDATLSRGFLPLVVPEFPGITVGGAVQGAAGESSSFRHGSVHDTCLEYELVLGNGEVMVVSPQNKPDLFYGTACSYGTLGVLTRITLQLQPARRFVHLSYIRTGPARQTITRLKHELRRTDIDLVDAIQFSPNHGVVMTGVYADQPLPHRSRFARSFDEWFYLHAQNISRRHATFTESIPIKDYLFRYDRGSFWGGKFVMKRLGVPFNRFFRWLLNPIMHTRRAYRLLHATNGAQHAIIQDICFPQKTVGSFVRYIENTYQLYPLWFCPVLTSRSRLDKLSPGLIEGDVLINVGVWGVRHVPYRQHILENRAIETKTRALGGRKVLYAHAYYPKSEFWQIYDKKWYDALRTQYHADKAFASIYDKVVVRKRLHMSRRKLWQALLGI